MTETDKDKLLKNAEARIRKILLALEHEGVTIENIRVDTRNFANLAVEVNGIMTKWVA